MSTYWWYLHFLTLSPAVIVDRNLKSILCIYKIKGGNFFKHTDSSVCLTLLLLLLFADFAGFVQSISHRSRHLPPGGPLFPHTLLLLSPWWPERGIRGGGGWRRKHGSRLQREEGEGHLLCHVGGCRFCHAVLVRRRNQMFSFFLHISMLPFSRGRSDIFKAVFCKKVSSAAWRTSSGNKIIFLLE